LRKGLLIDDFAPNSFPKFPVIFNSVCASSPSLFLVRKPNIDFDLIKLWQKLHILKKKKNHALQTNDEKPCVFLRPDVEESFKESYEVKIVRTVRINSLLVRM
jgi:hypothetical protein